MRIKEIKLYKFEELSSKRQEEEIDKHRDINTNHDWWSDIVDNKYTELETMGFDVPKNGIHIDGSYGTSASFSARVDVTRFLKFHDTTNKYPRILDHYKKDLFDIKIYEDKSARSYHPGIMDVEVTSEYDDNQSDDDDVQDLVAAALEGGGEIIDKIAEVGDWALEVAKEQCKKLAKDVDDTEQELMSDESVRETLISNEYEFEE